MTGKMKKEAALAGKAALNPTQYQKRKQGRPKKEK